MEGCEDNRDRPTLSPGRVGLPLAKDIMCYKERGRILLSDEVYLAKQFVPIDIAIGLRRLTSA